MQQKKGYTTHFFMNSYDYTKLKTYQLIFNMMVDNENINKEYDTETAIANAVHEYYKKKLKDRRQRELIKKDSTYEERCLKKTNITQSAVSKAMKHLKEVIEYQDKLYSVRSFRRKIKNNETAINKHEKYYKLVNVKNIESIITKNLATSLTKTNFITQNKMCMLSEGVFIFKLNENANISLSQFMKYTTNENLRNEVKKKLDEYINEYNKSVENDKKRKNNQQPQTLPSAPIIKWIPKEEQLDIKSKILCELFSEILPKEAVYDMKRFNSDFLIMLNDIDESKKYYGQKIKHIYSIIRS